MTLKEEVIQSLALSREQSKAFHRLTNPAHAEITRVVYGGQAGGGKSFLISIWLDYMCETYPETRYYLGRETLKEIKESILLTYFDVCKLTGSRSIYREHKSKIIYPNGSEIYLLETFEYPSDPNYDSFGSREYTAGAIEEGINVPRRAADLLISRTRYKHDVYDLTPKQLITCNPGESWIKDEIVIPQLETGKPAKANTIFIRATLESNPNQRFREAYHKTLDENLTAFDKARLLHGDWNARPKSGSEYLKEFNQDKHVGTYKQRYDPRLPLHIAFDENVNPYITCLIWQIQQEGQEQNIIQLDEICQAPPINTRKHVCTAIQKLYPKHQAGVFIYGDASSWSNDTAKDYGENFFTDIVTYLKGYNPSLRVPSKNPPVMAKGSFINLILEKRYRGLRLMIDFNCKRSIGDYAYAMEDVNGGILKKRVTDGQTGISYEKHGHHVDAMSYFLCEAFAGDFAFYLGGDKPTEYIFGHDRKDRFEW